jgi:prepilin-type N-terminal cleavage/methylation domain-containing protein
VTRIAVMARVREKTLRFSSLKGQAGFTLHETLVSIALISVGILGFAVSTTGVIRGNYFSGNVTVATHLAEDKIEELKVQSGLENINNCSGLPGSAAPDLNITATGSGGGIYSRCWVVGDSPLGAGLKQIDVTISWQDYLSRSITLSTLVYTESIRP